MKLPPFVLLEPPTVKDALAELSTPGSLPIAGGQGLLFRLRTGEARAHRLISLSGVDGLSNIADDNGSIRVGAHVTIRELMREAPPFLAEPASRIGNEAVRTLATVGGNLVHAVATSEILLTLLATGGHASVTLPSGRWETVEGMAVCELGARTVREGSLVTELTFPKPLAASFGEYGPQAYWVPQLAIAAVLRKDGSLAVACAVEEGPRRLFEAVPPDHARSHILERLASEPLASKLPPGWIAGVAAHHASLAMAQRKEGTR